MAFLHYNRAMRGLTDIRTTPGDAQHPREIVYILVKPLMAVL